MHHGEISDAAVLVERCLYVYESSFTPDFTFLEVGPPC